MDNESKLRLLELQIKQLELENKKLELKLEKIKGNHSWIWILVPLAAIIVGGFSNFLN